jgi:PAN domain
MKKLNATFIFLVLVGTLVKSHDAISQPALERNRDRPGLDYNNFDMRVNEPELCRLSCFVDTRCRAWTFVKPNTIQGPRPRCWLKNAVPNAVNNNCCVSGVL